MHFDPTSSDVVTVSTVFQKPGSFWECSCCPLSAASFFGIEELDGRALVQGAQVRPMSNVRHTGWLVQIAVFCAGSDQLAAVWLSLRESVPMNDQGPRLVSAIVHTWTTLVASQKRQAQGENFASAGCERFGGVGLDLHEVTWHGAVGEAVTAVGLGRVSGQSSRRRG